MIRYYCDKCGRSVEEKEYTWAGAGEYEMDLCKSCAEELKEVMRSWLRGGQCITIVNDDGTETILPMPTVPEGTRKLDDYTEEER